MSVRIRYRKTTGGFTAYLDLYQFGKRSYEYPRITMSTDYTRPLLDNEGKVIFDTNGKKKFPRPTPEDKVKLEILDKLRLQRELEIKNMEYNFADASLGHANFIEYAFAQTDGKKKAHYSYCIWKKLRECFGIVIPFKAISVTMVRKFLDYLKTLGTLSENTRNTYYNALVALFNKAKRDRLITENPCDLLSRTEKPKIMEGNRCYLTLEELQLLNALPPLKYNHQVKEAFLFDCLTGLRFSDLIKIRYADIVDGVLRYRQKKSVKDFHYLPLSEQAQAILSELAIDPKQEYCFWQLRKISVSTSLKVLNRWITQAITSKHVTWHVGRHTFATILLTFGSDIYTVSKLLGHGSVKITERYGKIINQKKVEAVNSIPTLKLSTNNG